MLSSHTPTLIPVRDQEQRPKLSGEICTLSTGSEAEKPFPDRAVAASNETRPVCCRQGAVKCQNLPAYHATPSRLRKCAFGRTEHSPAAATLQQAEIASRQDQ